MARGHEDQDSLLRSPAFFHPKTRVVLLFIMADDAIVVIPTAEVAPVPAVARALRLSIDLDSDDDDESSEYGGGDVHPLRRAAKFAIRSNIHLERLPEDRYGCAICKTSHRTVTGINKHFRTQSHLAKEHNKGLKRSLEADLVPPPPPQPQIPVVPAAAVDPLDVLTIVAAIRECHATIEKDARAMDESKGELAQLNLALEGKNRAIADVQTERGQRREGHGNINRHVERLGDQLARQTERLDRAAIRLTFTEDAVIARTREHDQLIEAIAATGRRIADIRVEIGALDDARDRHMTALKNLVGADAIDAHLDEQHVVREAKRIRLITTSFEQAGVVEPPPAPDPFGLTAALRHLDSVCWICHELLTPERKPVQFNCTHCLCFACADQMLKMQDPRCGICKGAIGAADARFYMPRPFE